MALSPADPVTRSGSWKVSRHPTFALYPGGMVAAGSDVNPASDTVAMDRATRASERLPLAAKCLDAIMEKGAMVWWDKNRCVESGQKILKRV